MTCLIPKLSKAAVYTSEDRSGEELLNSLADLGLSTDILLCGETILRMTQSIVEDVSIVVYRR